VSSQPFNSSAFQPFSGLYAGKTVWLSGHTGFISTYPGLTPAMLDYMVATIRHFTTAR